MTSSCDILHKIIAGSSSSCGWGMSAKVALMAAFLLVPNLPSVAVVLVPCATLEKAAEQGGNSIDFFGRRNSSKTAPESILPKAYV